MRDIFVFTMITKTRPWRHIYHDIKIPRPKSHDIEIPRPKSHDIEIPRPKSHDIKIPRPKSHNIEIPRPKSNDIEKQRQISHDMVILRRFFRGTKSHDIEIPRLKNQDIKIPRSKSHDIEFLWNSDLYAPSYPSLLILSGVSGITHSPPDLLNQEKFSRIFHILK